MPRIKPAVDREDHPLAGLGLARLRLARLRLAAAVVGLADRGVPAHFKGHAGDEERLDPLIDKDLVEVGGVKGSLAEFVDDGFTGDRVQLGGTVS
jgi:hypothetical protein